MFAHQPMPLGEAKFEFQMRILNLAKERSCGVLLFSNDTCEVPVLRAYNWVPQ